MTKANAIKSIIAKIDYHTREWRAVMGLDNLEDEGRDLDDLDKDDALSVEYHAASISALNEALRIIRSVKSFK